MELEDVGSVAVVPVDEGDSVSTIGLVAPPASVVICSVEVKEVGSLGTVVDSVVIVVVASVEVVDTTCGVVVQIRSVEVEDVGSVAVVPVDEVDSV